jgi:hypothetical protein
MKSCELLENNWGEWGQALLFDILQQFLFYPKVNGLFPFVFIDLHRTAYASDGMDS